MSQDKEFEQYLEGKAELNRLYAELPEVDAPAHLDAAILAEAHRAVGARPGARPKRRWTIPLGMVATLFVAVMIGLQLPYMLKDADRTKQLREEQMAALADKSSAERSSIGKEERRENREIAQLKSGLSRNEALPKAATSALAEPREEIAGKSRLLGAVSDAATPAPAIALQAPAARLPSPAERPPAPAKAAKSMELRGMAEEDNGAVPIKEKKSAGLAATADSESVGQPAPAAAPMAVPQTFQMKRSLKKDETILSPEDWLRRINKLKQEGRLEEAGKELAAFKKHYPEYVVPKALEEQ